MAFDIEYVRSQFPALASGAVFFDGPAGSQVPQRVIDAISKYLVECNANHDGAFATSIASDEVLDAARGAVADLLGTTDPAQVSFGANMTSLTFAFSRALGRTWKPGDEVLLSRLEHDANFTPWVLASRDAGATVRFVDIHPDDCTLNLEDLQAKLSDKTRLVAVGCASNAVGTVNPVGEICQWAHAAGAEVFLDAVHFAPHALLDVTSWDCDYLACSAYKFFGPHVGVLYGKREKMESLQPYKLRPAPDELPGRWETGTQNHEGIAGTGAAVEYLAELGRQVAQDALKRRRALIAAYTAIGEYEQQLLVRLLDGLSELPDVKVWGITDRARLGERLPTVSITHARRSPQEMSAALAAAGIYTWSGNYYALPVTEALGLEPAGMLRIGLLHYNTAAEVDRLLAELRSL